MKQNMITLTDNEYKTIALFDLKPDSDKFYSFSDLNDEFISDEGSIFLCDDECNLCDMNFLEYIGLYRIPLLKNNKFEYELRVCYKINNPSIGIEIRDCKYELLDLYWKLKLEDEFKFYKLKSKLY